MTASATVRAAILPESMDMVKLLGRTSGDQGSSASSTSGFMAIKEF
jgi:hypothetical protein